MSRQDSVYLTPSDLGLWGSSFLTQMSLFPHVGAGLLHDCRVAKMG